MAKGKATPNASATPKTSVKGPNLQSGASKDAMVNGDSDDLMESLERHDQAFNTLLSLIPAQFYLAKDPDDSPGTGANGLMKKRTASEIAEKKALIKEAKRAKLDPANFKNAAQTHQNKVASKKAQQSSTLADMEFDMDVAYLNGGRAGDTDSGEDDEEDDTSSSTQLTSVKSSDASAEKPIADSMRANGILDLRARLQAKIQGLQTKRKAPLGAADSPDAGGDDESVASTKDELLEERRRKRGEMRDRRRQAMKERRRAEREGKKAGITSGNSKKDSGNNSKAPALLVSDRQSTKNGTPSKTAVPESTSDLAFSSLEFGEGSEPQRKNRFALPSDPKAALAVLEARKRKEEARAAKRGEDAGPDTDKLERQRWSKVEAAAQGVKIRDDEALLKKAAKKKDKVKEKSRKEWNDREREQKEQAAARQKKRNDNIAARKDKSKKSGKGIGGKKMGGGGKKIKARAGFEGRGRSSKPPTKKTSHK